MFTFNFTTKFKKDIKLCEKRHYDFSLIETVFTYLHETASVPAEYKPHILKGEYKDCWECHIKPDWLLIWRILEETNEIDLVRTGTHLDLFK